MVLPGLLVGPLLLGSSVRVDLLPLPVGIPGCGDPVGVGAGEVGAQGNGQLPPEAGIIFGKSLGLRYGIDGGVGSFVSFGELGIDNLCELVLYPLVAHHPRLGGDPQDTSDVPVHKEFLNVRGGNFDCPGEIVSQDGHEERESLWVSWADPVKDCDNIGQGLQGLGNVLDVGDPRDLSRGAPVKPEFVRLVNLVKVVGFEVLQLQLTVSPIMGLVHS